MGVTVAVLSLVGILNVRWLAVETNKGQWFVKKWGEDKGIIVLRSLLFLFFLFGVLLASGVVNPVHWNETATGA